MKPFLLVLFAMLSFGTARAIEVDTSQKSVWKISATPVGPGTYNIIFHLELGFGWYTWSLHPGVDQSFIPPTFDIDRATASAVATPSEQGITTEIQLPGKTGYARIYTSEAMFILPVKAAKGKTVKGLYRYQLCNSKGCLPPKTVPFSVKLP